MCSFLDGLAAFRTFLKTEFSDENIEFWMACEDYKKIKSTAKLVSKANKIFKEFIDVQAPREVCLCECGYCIFLYLLTKRSLGPIRGYYRLVKLPPSRKKETCSFLCVGPPGSQRDPFHQ